MTNLVKAELQKIRTTSTWWIFGIILLPLWAAALLLNWAQSNLLVSDDETPGLDPN
ncbi:MAG: type transport system permease protein [Actinoplanes sp.]|jgi:hypothetical protein|nr:type transport system permease protein [Actinoplanes sp.]